MTPDDMAAIHARAMTTPAPWSAKTITDLMNSPGGFAVTTRHGFALGRVILDEAELLTLAVDPDHQRKGEGKDLLSAFEAEARAKGAQRAFLEVAAGNHAAKRLYLHANWRENGRRPGYYRHPDGSNSDALLMETAFLATDR